MAKAAKKKVSRATRLGDAGLSLEAAMRAAPDVKPAALGGNREWGVERPQAGAFPKDIMDAAAQAERAEIGRRQQVANAQRWEDRMKGSRTFPAHLLPSEGDAFGSDWPGGGRRGSLQGRTLQGTRTAAPQQQDSLLYRDKLTMAGMGLGGLQGLAQNQGRLQDIGSGFFTYVEPGRGQKLLNVMAGAAAGGLKGYTSGVQTEFQTEFKASQAAKRSAEALERDRQSDLARMQQTKLQQEGARERAQLSQAAAAARQQQEIADRQAARRNQQLMAMARANAAAGQARKKQLRDLGKLGFGSLAEQGAAAKSKRSLTTKLMEAQLRGKPSDVTPQEFGQTAFDLTRLPKFNIQPNAIIGKK